MRAAILTVLAVLALSCAEIPQRELTAAQASVLTAQRLGAERVEGAAKYVRLAQKRISQAQQLIASGERGRARGMLLRAEADAELALALAQEEPERLSAQQAVRRAQAAQRSLQ